MLYKQFSTTNPTANNTMATFQNIFGDCIINRHLWPDHSPSFMPSDYYLCTSWKAKAQSTHNRRGKI
jgi:hypothetical protein